MSKPEESSQEQVNNKLNSDRPTTAELVERYLLAVKAAGIKLEPYDAEKDAENRLWL